MHQQTGPLCVPKRLTFAIPLPFYKKTPQTRLKILHTKKDKVAQLLCQLLGILNSVISCLNHACICNGSLTPVSKFEQFLSQMLLSTIACLHARAEGFVTSRTSLRADFLVSLTKVNVIFYISPKSDI